MPIYSIAKIRTKLYFPILCVIPTNFGLTNHSLKINYAYLFNFSWFWRLAFYGLSLWYIWGCRKIWQNFHWLFHRLVIEIIHLFFCSYLGRLWCLSLDCWLGNFIIFVWLWGRSRLPVRLLKLGEECYFFQRCLEVSVMIMLDLYRFIRCLFWGLDLSANLRLFRILFLIFNLKLEMKKTSSIAFRSLLGENSFFSAVFRSAFHFFAAL